MDYVNLEIDSGIATVAFFTDKSNSLPSAILRKIAEKIQIADNATTANVIVLKSGGEKTFCAGASFDELLQVRDSESGKQFFSGFASVINQMRKCKKLIITQVQGKVVGGGIGIVAASDYSIASEKAAGKLSELSIGIGPFVIGPAVERKMGKSAFNQMSINAAAFYPASWLLEKGLYAEVAPNQAALEKRVAELAGQLAGYSSDAMQTLKRIQWEGSEDWDNLLASRAELSGQLVLSGFTRNKLNAFRNK